MTHTPPHPPAVSMWAASPVPAPHLGEESMVQHVLQAGPCRGLGGQQAGDEGLGVGREVGRQRVPSRSDAPVQLLPVSRLKRGAACQRHVPGGVQLLSGTGSTPPTCPPGPRLHGAAQSPDVRGHPMSLAVQNLWGQVAGRSTERPGETGTVSPSLAAAPPGSTTASLTPSAGQPVPPAVPAPDPRSSPASSRSPRSCLQREMRPSGTGAVHPPTAPALPHALSLRSWWTMPCPWRYLSPEMICRR